MAMKKYDVVIVGCGVAGTAAGLTALKENLNVCIVERKKREYIGKRPCGELMPLHTLEWVNKTFGMDLEYYPLKGLKICTVSEHKNSSDALCVKEPLCTINKWQFGQNMVDELLDRGADIYHGTVKSPLIDGGIKGVKTRETTFYSTVTIDCSGVFSVLNKEVTHKNALIAANPFGIAYKETVIVKESITSAYAMVLIDSTVIPSGYMWCFPKGEHELNTGIGGLLNYEVPLKKVLKKTLEAHTFLTINKRISTGFGALPLGSPSPSMVGPGLLVCGDAAGQVNPLTGEGIAPALTAGHLAGMTAAEAVNRNDPSVETMWKYNCDFIKVYGMLYGSLLALRDFLLSLSNDELSFLIQNVITSEDMEQLEGGEITHSLKRTLFLLLTSLKRPALLLRSYRALKRMTSIKEHYDCYPETLEEFPAWQQKLNTLLG